MSYKPQKMLRAFAFFLVACLAHGSVFAVVPGGDASNNSLGILNAADAETVKVNGNAAQDGMTILSGAEIQTGAGGATINLRQLGRVELGSGTTVKLVFTAGRIELQVIGGQAELTAFKGVTGVLTDPDGKSLTTDSTLETSSVGNGSVQVPVVPAPPAQTGLFGMGMWGTVAGFGGVIGGSVIAWVAATKPGKASQGPVSRVQP